MPRCFKLTGTDGGPLPPHRWLKVGAIVRVSSPDELIEAQWNDETGNWVQPIWTECEDPRQGGAA